MAGKTSSHQDSPQLFDQPSGSDSGAARKPLLLVMDGHAMVFRAWFALQQARPMTVRKTGEDVRGVYSFTSTFFKTMADRDPTHVAIVFDPPGPTFRHEQFVAYKANRPDAPKELHQNLERVKQVMRAFGVPIYELAGYEADDVLGTIAAYATENAIDCIIVTGDTDTLQLVSPQVSVLLTTGFGDTSCTAKRLSASATAASSPISSATSRRSRATPPTTSPASRGSARRRRSS